MADIEWIARQAFRAGWWRRDRESALGATVDRRNAMEDADIPAIIRSYTAPEAQEPEREVTSRKSRRGPQYRCAECSRGFMPKGPMIQHLMGSAHGMGRGAAEAALEYAQPCAVHPVSAAHNPNKETMMEPLIWVATLGYGGTSYTTPMSDLSGLTDELRAAMDDDEEREYTVRVHQMTQDEYDALPDFDGF